MRKILISLLLLGMAITAFATSNGDFFPDIIILRIDRTIPGISIYQASDGCRFGNPNLDAVCERWGVSLIEKLFPWEKPSDSEYDFSRVFAVYFPVEVNPNDIIDDFTGLQEVIYAEPFFIRKTSYTPNDPNFGLQWGLNSTHTQAELAFDYCRGDSTVTLAIIDSGIDMDHPDLVGNLWVNPGEDLNHNWVVDPGEMNNIDDDQNGFIDDFWGWDFISNDNYPNDEVPSPLGGHGTHTSGIASAQTDNGIGVASLGFNCSIIPVRTGAGMYIYYAYQGVQYAIGVGADVISMSYGSPQWSNLEQEQFNYAHSQGSACIAAAGNDNSSSPQYPAAYNYVFAVASTNVNDLKSGFSNYGAWVDISAPGSGILSTYLNGGYAYMDGTSMACPFTAGLAGLVKSAYPTMTVDEIYEIIQETADDIYPLNPGYIGLLGAGRINAYQAMEMNLSPNLSYSDIEIIDDGNGDGRADPGENADMIVTLENASNWQNAQDISATITCTVPGITILDGQADYPDIAAGQSGSNQDSPFRFSVSLNFTPAWVDFILTVNCRPNNYVYIDTLQILVGRPPILLVDDDWGDNFETYYFTPLNNLDRVYEYWDNSQGFLTDSLLNLYELVIWFTGSQSQFTISPLEQYYLQAYLNQGGKLLLSGQYIGDDIGTGDFYSDYLHAEFINGNSGSGVMVGIPGNPISNNALVLIMGGAGNGMLSPSVIAPIAPAEPLLYYSNTTNASGLTYVSPVNGGRLVYLEFAFEAIGGGGVATSSTELMSAILDWFEAPNAVQNQTNNSIEKFGLWEAYPNPFNSSVALRFEMRDASEIDLRIYDVAGREITKLETRNSKLGTNQVLWDAEGVPTGIYFARLSVIGSRSSEIGGQSSVQKLLLLK